MTSTLISEKAHCDERKTKLDYDDTNWFIGFYMDCVGDYRIDYENVVDDLLVISNCSAIKG